jgi:hypothetical protein
VPVFGPGGEVVAAIELAVGNLGREPQQIIAARAIASRSLRDLAGQARPTRLIPRHREPTHLPGAAPTAAAGDKAPWLG